MATASPAGAVALYEWNLAMSAAVFETLAAVEVILRNAFHLQLARSAITFCGCSSAALKTQRHCG